MNIAMIGQKQVPSREGGIEVVVSELARRMAEKGHNVTCFNRKGKAEDENTVPYKIITVPTVKKKGLAAASSSFFAAVRAAAGRISADTVQNSTTPANTVTAFCHLLWLSFLRSTDSSLFTFFCSFFFISVSSSFFLN